jgi:hypothetical protein
MLSQPGTVEMDFLIDPPAEARGKTLDVEFGIWVPDRIGRLDERLIPDSGALDRRVDVGRMQVGEDGLVTMVRQE